MISSQLLPWIQKKMRTHRLQMMMKNSLTLLRRRGSEAGRKREAEVIKQLIQVRERGRGHLYHSSISHHCQIHYHCQFPHHCLHSHLQVLSLIPLLRPRRTRLMLLRPQTPNTVLSLLDVTRSQMPTRRGSWSVASGESRHAKLPQTFGVPCGTTCESLQD